MKPSEIFWTITSIIVLFLVKGLLYYFIIPIDQIVLIEAFLLLLWAGYMGIISEYDRLKGLDLFMLSVSISTVFIFIIVIISVCLIGIIQTHITKFNNWLDGRF